MSLLEYRDGVVAGIKGVVPNRVLVDTSSGRLDAKEIARMGAHAPGVYVASLGFSNIDILAGQVIADVQMAAFLVAKDEPRMPRETTVLALLQLVSRAVAKGDAWQASVVVRPSAPRADNLFTAEVDAKGISLWAVSWRQSVEICPLEAADPSTLDDFLRCDTTTELADGAPVAEDHITLPQGDEA